MILKSKTFLNHKDLVDFVNKEMKIMKKYDIEMERENISKGYTRAEVLEMLVDLFDTVF